MSELLLKLGGLVAFQQVVSMIRVIVTRFIIKTQFSASEVTLMSWFTWDFINSLSVGRVVGLGIIAGFTLITFPLGVWIGSFKLGLAIPVIYMVGFAASMLIDPLNLFVINKTLGEMNLSNKTLGGLLIVEIGYAIIIGGYWFIYSSNQVIT